ncbi:MAG: hypothetical protein WCB53_09850 [Terriglobales bacterium]
MKTIGFNIGTASLALLLGIVAPVYAQHEQQPEKQDHPQQQESKHEQAKPAQQHAQKQPSQHAAQPKQSENKQTGQRAQQQQKSETKQTEQRAQQQPKNQKKQTEQHAQQHPGNQHPKPTPQQQRVEQASWQQHRSQNWNSDHRTWQQRGGYHGYRIPDDRFRGYFGADHGFRIYGLPFLVVGGFPRFQYDGYWISLVDPWPEDWGNDWYDNDDVYVTYVDNGYYLFNSRFPNIGIAISISM